MTTADLLSLADREADMLAVKDPAAAAVVRALTERVRMLCEKLRNAGVKEPEAKAA